MTFAAVVRFWFRQDRAGYSKLWLATSQFGWMLSEREFEVIHGISRFVNLIPNQLANARDLRQNRQWEQANDCIEFLLRILRFYRSLLDLHGDEQRNEDCDEGFEVELNADEMHILESTRGLDLFETLNLLESCTQGLLNVASQDDFVNQASDLVALADWVRLASNIYVIFAHPLLVWSRRPGAAFQDPDELRRRSETVMAWAQNNLHYLATQWNSN